MRLFYCFVLLNFDQLINNFLLCFVQVQRVHGRPLGEEAVEGRRSFRRLRQAEDERLVQEPVHLHGRARPRQQVRKRHLHLQHPDVGPPRRGHLRGHHRKGRFHVP